MDFDAIWLELTQFFTIDLWLKTINIVVIIVGALVLRWVLHFVIERVVQQIVSGVKKNQNVLDTQALSVSPLAAVRVVQRTRTLGSVLSNILNVTLLIVSILLIVNIINTDILGSFALLTAALGAGLGFGAQNIVKDILNGLFMVVEDQIGVGDIVDVGFASGVVETVGIRVTQVRDVDGTLWFVRNGEILRVGNMSQGWARVIIDLAIPYSSDVEAVQNELLRVAKALASSRKWRPVILEKPEIWGLESISAEALVVRLVVKTRVAAKWDFARDLRLHLKKALDGLGIGLTPLNSVVMAGKDGAINAGTTPAFEDAPDAAVEAAASMPDIATSPFTAPVTMRKNKAPRAPRRPKSDTVTPEKAEPEASKPAASKPEAPKSEASRPITPRPVTPRAESPKAETPKTEPARNTAPDPEIRDDE
ncbi:mechanosensitive ion channel [Cryobacterium sp. TMT1-21]|uniref:Mechanosensitive ion channel n=1 Tax=Cryobacterium shii TaxID=1259235 RepID=A0AAQ2C7D7_9MICO|nr:MULTISPECIES: mechanosensitive ion channel domain-containing protein [Cryobacterium]TFC49829.1 mechanosensitive ion channel [Cryobacterium shii]TFD16733.1 mechanosensitive ion channel [Cryobacterium sp. TMT1-21]TFD38544.1 mechanosensitive ion channel [Cryobacterium sp. TMT2-10]